MIMVYGDGCHSATDFSLYMEDKKLYFEDRSRTFGFELEKKELYVTTSIEKFVDKLEHFYMEGKNVYVNNHLIEGTSLYYGDMLCDNFDEQNNMVNPVSDVGWYLYNLFGFVFGSIQEMLNDMLLRIDPACGSPYLDIIAKEFGLKRKAEWSDQYWRALIISYYYNLETIQGIEYVINRMHACYTGNNDEKHIDVDVDGQYALFYLSDKFDTLSKCSDKFEEIEDRVSSIKDYIFKVNPGIVYDNPTIDELMDILNRGRVK